MANKFINYLQKSKADLKELEKQEILKKAIINRSFYLKNPLQINHQLTKIMIRWLKNAQEIADYLAPLKELDYQKGFLITAQSGFSTKDFAINYDVIVCDLNWRVQEIHPSLKPNTNLNSFQKTSHVFVLCESSITYYSIEVGDFVNACTNVKN